MKDMEKKTEKLPVEVIEKLKKLNSEIESKLINLGFIDIEINNLTKNIETYNSEKTKLISLYNDSKSALDLELKILESKYPVGIINLVTGNLEFE
jgi:hypothetical protein